MEKIMSEETQTEEQEFTGEQPAAEVFGEAEAKAEPIHVTCLRSMNETLKLLESRPRKSTANTNCIEDLKQAIKWLETDTHS